jgi:Tol biopolymer transport system component
MKKLALTLAMAVLTVAIGCGNSKSPVLTYVSRANSGTSSAPQLFRLDEATQQSTAVQIPIPATAYFITANRDATAVTYCRDNGSSVYDIYLMGVDGVEKQLTTNANACESVFSPDGKTIAFVNGESGDFLIYTMRVDGSNQKPLFSPAAGTAESFYPEFSADGKSLVFFTGVNSGPSAAKQMHVNGRTPSWPTQGLVRSKKAHSATTAPGITDTGWYIMGLSDTAPTFVYSPNSWWGPAVFSADGKTLLLTDYDGTDYNIFSVNLDGSGLTPLTTSTDTDNFSPLPYKKLIMFNRYNSTNNSWDIYSMDQTGNNQNLVHSTNDTWEVLVESYWSGD